MKKRTQALLIHTVALAIMLGTAQAHAAIISVLASGGFDNATASGADLNIYTKAFDALAGSEMLVVSVHADSYALSSLTYGGVAMNLVPNTATGDLRVQGIWYLANPSSTGNIVATFGAPLPGGTGKEVGLAVASLSSSDGNAIVVGDSDFATGTVVAEPTLTLTIPENDSFVFVAVGSNGNNDAVLSGTHLPTQMNILSIDSMGADARYANGVASGTSPTYTFNSTNTTATNAAVIAGASFHVVPEPGSLALLGLGGGMMLIAMRRRGRRWEN